MLNFVFEDTDELLNAFSHDEKIGGLSRVVLSPWVNRIRQLSVYYSAVHDTLDNNIVEFYDENIKINFLSIDNIGTDKYIIPIGVNENPRKWIGGGYADKGTDEYQFEELFDKLNDKYLEDLRSKKAFFLIDSSLEGYHDQCIFDWIYDQCRFRHISPKQVIYVTGNSDIENRVKEWEDNNKEKTSPIVIPYSHFEFDIAEVVRKRNDKTQNKVPTFYNHLEYKKENLKNIKIYNFLNKKPRTHRVWFYHTLKNWNLLDDGLISMNKFDDSKDLIIDFAHTEQRWLPETNETLPTYAYGISNEVEDFRFYMDNLNEQSTLDSWISIVSEAQFEDNQGTVFLSEKVYKPIACQHPFVILGNKHSLRELHKLGYKTFHDLIDESYDELDSIDRIDAIIDIINNIKSNPNKLQWFEWMRPKLEYNFKVLQFNSLFKPPHGFYQLIKLLK